VVDADEGLDEGLLHDSELLERQWALVELSVLDTVGEQRLDDVDELDRA
jgi:hypothetical protein